MVRRTITAKLVVIEDDANGDGKRAPRGAYLTVERIMEFLRDTLLVQNKWLDVSIEYEVEEHELDV